MTENAHFCSKFKSNTISKLRRTWQIQFWHSQSSSKALNFENLCINTFFLIEKSDFLAHFHLLKCSFSLQIQVQDHFWTQQSIPNTILELSDLSWTFKKRISYINTHFLVQKSDILLILSHFLTFCALSFDSQATHRPHTCPQVNFRKSLRGFRRYLTHRNMLGSDITAPRTIPFFTEIKLKLKIHQPL